jgi:hypothetical protein
MNRNPYAPPTAQVADLPPAPKGEIDPNVLRACKLIWWSFGLGIVVEGLVLAYMPVPSGAGRVGFAVGVLIALVIGFFIVRWIVSKLRAGRNWMRLLYTILCLLGLAWLLLAPGAARTTLTLYTNNPVMGVAGTANWILSIWVVFLLNTRSARAWFTAASPP